MKAARSLCRNAGNDTGIDGTLEEMPVQVSQYIGWPVLLENADLDSILRSAFSVWSGRWSVLACDTHASMKVAAILVLIALGHASCKRRPAPGDNTATHEKPLPSKVVEIKVVETEYFMLPLPKGYDNVSATFQKDAPHLSVVFTANKMIDGYQPTITVQKAPIPGGSFADPTTCAQTGNGLMTGGTEAPGIEGTLKSATIIDGPVGKTCQIHLLAPEGIALITELHRPGNTPTTPHDVWLMTCNHADGDKNSEAICRSTLSDFRFRQ